ncbi:gliding motility-associated C-terminal domain-containing protein [Mucilaginibacter ginsenosidivorans]|nr:gliding motility-associated C-terminal domain-containing protein [Mucilaginibacter ginsenosidivorans]
MVVTNADCQEANGSITGIKIISTSTKINYTWYNSAKTIVGHTADLKNIPAGLYYLMISDNSDCVNNITSKKILVANENAISMDESGASTIDASCGNGGAISGISVIGATEYDWYNIATKTIVSASIISPDLLNVQPGEYQLNAHNSTCQSISRIYTISSEVKVPKVIDYSTVDPICPVDNGSISVTLSIQSQQPKLKFYFTDSTGSHLFDGVITGDNPNPVLTATGLYGGIFYLYVQDDNNCSVLLGTYTLTEANVYISQTETEVVNDRCNQHLGYIAPVIKGYKESKGDQYTWTDVNTGQVVGKNKILSKVGAGTYQLKIITVAGCRGKAVFTLNNISPALVPPIAEGTTSCLPSLINITVTNVDTSKLFRLYDSPTSTVPIDSSKTGIFYKQVDQTTDYYVTRVSKDCESDRTKVTETVVVSIKIPNAFTPNSDGVNDTWAINGIDKFPGADLKIFTRYGKLIYHSIDYPVPFDGTHNGSPLPAGAYYYILDVKQPICYGKISGSITIIR